MPVFHTKTIEAILEPVAQQVSQLVILHEEAQDGNAMPDLSTPVMAVSAAVQNLVRVGRDTAASTDDKILKQEMPPSLERVEESAKGLYQAAMILKGDPYSQPARKMLIDGARGILNGTSDLLLVFDQSEVRKIVRVAKGVLEYLAVAEVVESMEDLITFVKNLSPGMTNLGHRVTSRSKELTHAAHAKGLIDHTDSLKRTTPILVSAIKIFVTTSQKGGRGKEEAQQNRNFIIGRMSHDVNEIIRILQLTSADDDFSMDDISIMKKSLLNITNSMTMAQTWLSNPNAEPGGLGEKAVRDILKDARRVADCIEGPQREKLLATIKEIEDMMDELCALRAKGQGNSPRALELARLIGQKLGQLQGQVSSIVKQAEVSGVTRCAYTLAGKVEQAQSWLRNPAHKDGGVGRRAIAGIVAQGRRVAQNLTGQEKAELLRLCDEVEALAEQVADFARRGQGNSPQCLEVARRLAELLPVLQKKIEHALVKEVGDVFMDTSTPLKELERAAKAPIDVPDREPTFVSKATVFLNHANKISETAKAVAEAGPSGDRPLVEALNAKAQEVQDLAPQVVHAGRVLLLNPGEQNAVAHFDEMKREYMNKVDDLTNLVDQAVDTVEFVKASEEAIKRESEKVARAIDSNDPNTVAEKASSIARRAQRVAVVASKEAANSEDPKFVQDVTHAANQLSSDIPPTVTAAKGVALNTADRGAQDKWYGANKKLVKSVAAIRIPLTVELPVEESFPPPPPLPPPAAMEQAVPQRGPSFESVQRAAGSATEMAPPVPPPPASSAYSKQATPSSQPPYRNVIPPTPSTLSSSLTGFPYHHDNQYHHHSPHSQSQPLNGSHDLAIGQGSTQRAPYGTMHQPANQYGTQGFDLPDELRDDLDAVLKTFPNFPVTPSVETPAFALPPQKSAAPSTAPKPRQLQSDVGDVRQALMVNQEPTIPPPPDMSQLRLEEEAAPPRPPLPGDLPPPRPPPPEDQSLPLPVQGSEQPIMQAAYDLHLETAQWSSKDNDLIAAAKRMAQLMAAMSKHVSGENTSKKELIQIAKKIAEAANGFVKLAKEIADQCTDKRMKNNLLQVCERIPTISTQLKILSTVKAVMLGSQESEEDQEATEMLVGNAQNLMKAVKETVRAAKAASIKIRTDAGYKMRWVRQRPWYQ